MTIKRTAHDLAPAISAAAVLALTGAPAAVAQTTVQEQPLTEQQQTGAITRDAAEPLSPAATESGWGDIGTWGIIALVVIVALVAWFLFFRPRAKPESRPRH